MTVAFDAKATANTHTTYGSGGFTTLSNANMTVGSGSNRALIAVVAWSSDSGVPTAPTARWDTAGANQAMTQIGSTVHDDSGNGVFVAMFGLIAPVSGNKNFTISWTGACQCECDLISFTGVDQTNIATAFPNFNSATGSASPATVNVTSAAGDYTVAAFVIGGDFNSGGQNQTLMYWDTTNNLLNSGSTYALGSASNTHSWTTITGGWAVVGCDVKWDGSGPPPPTVITATGPGSYTFPAAGTLVLEAWGAGASGGRRGKGSGGGAYAKTNSINVSAGQTLYWNVALGPAGTITTTGGTPASDSWARLGTNSAPSSTTDGVLAAHGTPGDATNVGAGGTTAASIGDVEYAGGAGGTVGSGTTLRGGGGGGAGSAAGGGAASGATNGTGGSPDGGNGGAGTSTAAGGAGLDPGGGGGSTYSATGTGGVGGDGQIRYTFTPLTIAVLVPSGLAVAAPAIGASAIAQNNVLAPAALADAALTIPAATLGQRAALSATQLADAAPTIPAPVIGVKYNPQPAAIAVPAPTLGAPPLNQADVLATVDLADSAPSLPALTLIIIGSFTAPDLIDGAPTLDAPVLNQADALVTTALSDSPPSLGSPVLAPKSILSAAALADGAPAFDVPAFGQADAFSAAGLACPVPSLGTATFGQNDHLAAVGIADGAPSTPLATFNQNSVLAAAPIADSAPTVGTPAFGQRAILAAVPIADAAPALGTPSIAQVQVLATTGLADAAPTIPAAPFGQAGVWTATNLADSAPIIGAPVIRQRNVLAAAALADSAPTLDGGSFNQADVLSIDAVGGGALALGNANSGGSAGSFVTSSTMTAPTGIVNGDLLIAAITTVMTLSDADPGAISLTNAGSGAAWTKLYDTYILGYRGFRFAVFAKTANGESGNYTASWTAAASTGWGIVDVSNASASPIDVSAVATAGAGGAATPWPAPALTGLAGSDDMLLCLWGNPGGNGPYTLPVGMTSVVNYDDGNAGNGAVIIASLALSSNANTPAKTVTPTYADVAVMVSIAVSAQQTNIGLFDSAPALGAPTLTRIYAFTTAALADSAPALGTSSLHQKHVLASPGLADAAPSIPAPTTGAGYTFTTPSLAAAAPAVGSPLFGQADVLVPAGVAAAAPVFAAATFAQRNVLVPSGLAVSAPTVGAPAFVAKAGLAAADLSDSPPQFDAPVQVTKSNLAVLLFSTGPPAFGSPAINVVPSAANLADSPPAFGSPLLATALTASPLADGAPSLGVEIFGQFDVLSAAGLAIAAPTIPAASIGQQDALSAADLASAAPAISSPAFGQRDILAAVVMLGSAPSLGNPAIAQTHVLPAATLADAASATAPPTFAQRNALATAGLIDGAPIIGSAAFIITLAAAPLADGVPTIGAPLFARVITAASFVDGAPSFGSAAVGQRDYLAAAGLADSAPTILAATLGQSDVLAATFIHSAPTLDAPAIAQKNVLVPSGVLVGPPTYFATIGQHDFLSPASLAVSAPPFAVPSEAVSLQATALTDGAPALDAATIFQKNVLPPAALLDSAPTFGRPTTTKLVQLTAVPLTDSSPAIAAVTITHQKHALAAADLSAGNPVFQFKFALTAISLRVGSPIFSSAVWNNLLRAAPLLDSAPSFAAQAITRIYTPPIVSIPADEQLNDSGNPIQQALFTNFNDDVLLLVAGNTIVGRGPNLTMGPAQAVEMVYPLQLLSTANGLQLWSGGLEATALAGGIPVYPGGGGAAVPTSISTWLDSVLAPIAVGQVVVRGASGWVAATVPNIGLTNPSVTISGHVLALGGSLALASGDISGLASSATTDTTNASNISSGTIPAARLPVPSTTTLGGVQSIVAVAHKFVTSISTLGVPVLAQPAAADISGLGYFATGTDASNLSGAVNNARLSGLAAIAFSGSASDLSGLSLGTFASRNYATPPVIGGTTPNVGNFTALNAADDLNVYGNAYLNTNAYVGGNLNVGSNVGITGQTVIRAALAGNWTLIVCNLNGGVNDYGMYIAAGASGATDPSTVMIGFYDSTASFGLGYIVRNGAGSIAYTTGSDIRGKPNRELLDLKRARATIDALKIWDFDKDGNDIRGVGVIAQEAHAVSKYFASSGKDADTWWSSEKAAPVPYLIANMQQANARLDALEARLH